MHVMKITATHMEGLLVIEPNVYRDSRGYFLETYHRSRLESLGIGREFIQDNQSRSVHGVIRGLHFQREPHAQAKLIPDCFAYRFSFLSGHATVFYKCDAYYHPESESGIRYDDPDLRIDWKIDPASAVISEKDRLLPLFKDL